MFSVVHERGAAAPLLDDPLIHCQAARQLVLAYVSRSALMDYFRISGDKRIIEGKFERDEWEIEKRLGQSYPRMLITLEDMQRSGEQFTTEGSDFR